MVLTKDNLEAYLKEHFSGFCQGPLTISVIGDDPDDNPGLINYVYRVRCGNASCIVKQGRTDAVSNANVQLPCDRNRMECESLVMRGTICPGQVPEVYVQDNENNVFIMEDVSYLRPSRLLLTEGKILPDFGRQCGAFAAANSFYFSEFYLDVDEFRALGQHFTNSKMRQIMETWVFLRTAPYDRKDHSMDALREDLDHDKAFNAQVHLLRHDFMTRGECLVDADMHTSNIFADETRIKVLDMEYTFAGPFDYDIGYLVGSLITQYCSACFRPFPTEEARRQFKAYILKTIFDVYDSFCQNFSDHWDADAKDIYKAAPEFKDELLKRVLPDMLGFAAIPTFTMSVPNIGIVNEYAVITDPDARKNAMSLCVYIAKTLLMKRHTFANIGQAIAAMVEIEEIFMKNLR